MCVWRFGEDRSDMVVEEDEDEDEEYETKRSTHHVWSPEKDREMVSPSASDAVPVL